MTEKRQVSADEAMARLVDGNRRFVDGIQESRPPAMQVVAELSKEGQNPFAIVLHCSDSPVGAETLFDGGVGEIFTHSVAGNVRTVEGTASFELALRQFDCPVLIVLGHTYCRTVGNAVTTPLGREGPTQNLSVLISHIQGNLSGHSCNGRPSFRAAAELNALRTAVRLVKSPGEIQQRVTAGSLEVIPALHDLETGVVEFCDPVFL